MPDTHEDIRRRLFEAAWEAPAFAPTPRRTIMRARRRAAFAIFGGATAVVAAFVAIILAAGGVPLAEGDSTGRDVPGEDPREYLVDATTGQQTVHGTLPSGAWLYDISPDGSRVTFVAEAEGRNQVWIMHMDGTGLRQLTHDPFEAIDPAWSPDGTKIVYVGFGRGDSRDLFVIDVAGGQSDRIMTEPDDPWNPGWSADGSRILYWSRHATDDPTDVPTTTTTLQVRSVRVETGRVSVLAGRTHTGAWEGAWDEQSGRIAFIAAHFEVGSGDSDHALWLMDGDGSRKEQLLSLDVDDAWGTTWSPDGSEIAYVVSQHGGFFVHVFDLATGEDRQVAPGEFADWVDDSTLLVQEFVPAP